MNGARPAGRLIALDALRGFDMFWIVGGREVVIALAATVDFGPFHWMAEQCEHVEWDGFRLWDLIFPLFLFLAGAALPFSMGRRIERGDSRRRLHAHAIRRGLLLVLLGVIYNARHDLVELDFERLRYASVLGRIGLAWMFAAIVFLNHGLRGQIAWCAGLLVAYWAALTFVPVPEFGAGNLAPGRTLTDWVDRLLVPGRLHRGERDPEGLFSTIPAVSTALLGALAGHLLRSRASEARKVVALVLGAAACLTCGWLWSRSFPLNKNLWSSSFVLWTGGYSLALLAAFYLVIDVLGFRRWTFFFVVIGANAITVYMLGRFVDWSGLIDSATAGHLHPLALALAAIGVQWLVLFALYRKRLFLKV